VARVFTIGAFVVYVYAERGNPHKQPHCHVNGKGTSTVVAIRTLTVLAGPKLPRNVRQALLDGLDELIARWEQLNPTSEDGETE